jgi:hypothetical protein
MGCFISCWLPFFILAILKPIPLSNGKAIRDYIPSWLDSFLLWLGYCNSALNPIIYARFNREFRRPFVEILCFRCRGINEKLRNSDRKKMLKDANAKNIRPSVNMQRSSDGSTNYNLNEAYIKQKVLSFNNRQQTPTSTPTPPPILNDPNSSISRPQTRTSTPTSAYLDNKQPSNDVPQPNADECDIDDVSLHLIYDQTKLSSKPVEPVSSPSLLSTRFYSVAKYPCNATLRLNKLDYAIEIKSLNSNSALNENDKENSFKTISLHATPNLLQNSEDLIDEADYPISRTLKKNSMKTLREEFYRSRNDQCGANRSLHLTHNSKLFDNNNNNNNKKNDNNSDSSSSNCNNQNKPLIMTIPTAQIT